MEETALLLVNSLDDAARCETILEAYCNRLQYISNKGDRSSLLFSFIKYVDNSLFRKLFHINKATVEDIKKEIEETKTFKTSLLVNYMKEDVIAFICVAVLYIHSILSIRACSLFSGYSVTVVDSYVNLFNKIMNELKDRVIRFPALANQGLLRINSKRLFPGAVGVLDSVFIPKLYAPDDNAYSYSEEYQKQGVKILLVVGREGRFFNIHISESGCRSNCSIFNESALGVTLRFSKRSVLNRGSFLLADRSYPELPYIQIPFSTREIQQSPTALSNYNYWHHKARFIARKSIERWLYRSPKCREGLPFPASRTCIAFIISSLVLQQLCQTCGDEWVENDRNIQCLILASEDGEEHEEVNEECYKIYDTPTSDMGETDYYDLKNLRMNGVGEEIDEEIQNSIYEKLKIVARKRRDFLVDLIKKYPNRAIPYNDD